MMRYMGFQSGAGKKLRAKMNAVIKSVSEEIAVDKVDYLRSESHTDIDIPIWVYSASSNARQTVFGGQVSDNASVDYMGFRYRESSVSAGEQDRQFVLVFTVRNEAGALAEAINIIGRFGFNMRTLRSRPMKELLWQYYFYVEADGNIGSAAGKLMIKELGKYCDHLRVVGNFPHETKI